jgi:hypothetical protein
MCARSYVCLCEGSYRHLNDEMYKEDFAKINFSYFVGFFSVIQCCVFTFIKKQDFEMTQVTVHLSHGTSSSKQFLSQCKHSNTFIFSRTMVLITTSTLATCCLRRYTYCFLIVLSRTILFGQHLFVIVLFTRVTYSVNKNTINT